MNYSNSAIPKQPWNDVMEELRYLISSDTFHHNSCLVKGYQTLNDYVGENEYVFIINHMINYIFNDMSDSTISSSKSS
jgi:hypothetical protein